MKKLIVLLVALSSVSSFAGVSFKVVCENTGIYNDNNITLDFEKRLNSKIKALENPGLGAVVNILDVSAPSASISTSEYRNGAVICVTVKLSQLP